MGFLDDLFSGLGDVSSGLNTGAQGLNNFFNSPGGGLLSGLGTLGLAGFNAANQYGIQQSLQNPFKRIGPVPPSAQENIKQSVEGQMMGQVGSATPAAEAQGLSNADWQYQLAAVGQYLDSLKAAGAMGSGPTGSIEQLMAQLTGGLGRQYAQSGDLNPIGQTFNMGANSTDDPTLTGAFNTLGNLTGQGMFIG